MSPLWMLIRYQSARAGVTEARSMSSSAVATYVHARDPISQAGVVAQLRMRPEIRVVETAAQAAVAVMIADTVDDNTTRELRAMRKDGQPRLMLVATAVDDAALVAAAEAGVAGLLRRCDASADMLVRTIVKVASGEGEVPADLLGRLLEQVGRLQRQVLAPRGLTFTGLTPRETRCCGSSRTGSTPARSRCGCATASAP